MKIINIIICMFICFQKLHALDDGKYVITCSNEIKGGENHAFRSIILNIQSNKIVSAVISQYKGEIVRVVDHKINYLDDAQDTFLVHFDWSITERLSDGKEYKKLYHFVMTIKDNEGVGVNLDLGEADGMLIHGKFAKIPSSS